MPGFRITNIQSDLELKDYRYSKLQRDSIVFEEWSVKRATLDKFHDDKLFFEDEDYLIVLEGVVLNSKELTQKHGLDSWKKTVIQMIATEGHEWFKYLEGPLSGAVYFKKDRKWIVFTGYLGEKAIYYWEKDGKTIIASQLGYITDLMKENGIDRNPNEEALCRLVSYGSYVGSETCIKEITRLYPGEYLIYDISGINVFSYGLIDVKQDCGTAVKTENEYIDTLDSTFKKAIKRILDKNREYGYTTVVDLSGGYDSRLNAYAVNSLREKDDKIIAACYGQSGCHDERVAKAIASELGLEFVFMSLDSGSCLIGVDDNVRMLNGATHYCGITGGRDILHILSGLNIGLEVTGLLGGVHDGSMVTTYSDGDIDPDDYVESSVLKRDLDFVFPEAEEKRFRNHRNEHFWFYNRGMICGMGSFFICQNFAEPVTAFGDIKFIREYLTVPWDLRVKRRLLRKWLAAKYPDAAEYTNGRTGMKLKFELDRKGMIISRFAKQINKIRRYIKRGSVPIGMNDMLYWYENNAGTREYIDRKLSERIVEIESYKKLSTVMDKLKSSRSFVDKDAYMTVNAIFRNFII